VYTNHTITNPTKDTALLPKAVQKAAAKSAPPGLHRYSQDEEHVSVYTIPSEDMALAVARYRESVEIQGRERFDTSASSGAGSGTLSTMPSGAGCISSAHENTDAIALFAERLEERLALACAAREPILSEHEKLEEAVLLLRGQRLSDATSEASACDIGQRSEATAHRSGPEVSSGPVVTSRSDEGTTEHRFNRCDHPIGDPQSSGKQTSIDQGGQCSVRVAVETAASVAGEPSCHVLPPGGTVTCEQSRAGVCVHQGCVHLQRASHEGAYLHGTVALHQETSVTVPRKAWEVQEPAGHATTRTVVRCGLPSAQPSSGLGSTSSVQKQLLRSKRRHPDDLDALSPDKDAAIGSATGVDTARHERLLNSQVRRLLHTEMSPMFRLSAPPLQY
jgi:hypothetical protein